MLEDVYDKNFYKGQKDISYLSAKEILPLIVDLLNPNTVIDIGCGLGTWLSVFKELGVKDILGLDGNWVNENSLYIDKKDFIKTNLENPINFDEKFDLAISLEVAEHLSNDNAHNFIKYLTSKSNFILFSAAVPYQGGTNHINEQWQSYWIDIFEENGFKTIDFLRPLIWNNDKIGWWYRQNIFLFIKNDYFNEFKNNLPKFESLVNIVHPESFINCRKHLNNHEINSKHYREQIENYEKNLNNCKKRIKNHENEIKIYDEKVETFKGNIKLYKNKIRENRKEILKIKNSNSWKITKPMRNIGRILKINGNKK